VAGAQAASAARAPRKGGDVLTVAGVPEASPDGTGTQTDEVSDAYRIEIDTAACEHCGVGETWNVIGPDGVALGIVYGEQDDAIETADMLSRAFALGREAALASAAAPDERVRAETEACAKAADEIARLNENSVLDGSDRTYMACAMTARDVAKAIRARTPDQDTAP
jgi:hypothetical protein